MTQNDIRRKALRKEEPLYRQQAPYLRRMGQRKASITENDDIADKLRDLDLLAWDETDRYLTRFSEDLDDAPYVVTDLLAETASLGRTIGMEVELPPLIAALTFVRIMAGGDDVFEKHQPIWIAIMRSQDLDPQGSPFFERFCQEIEANKLDPSNHKETLYRRGDPLERAKDAEEAKAEARSEELLGQILEATKGWNTEKVFGNYWEQWTELWVHLLKQEEMVEKISQKCPNSKSNFTKIHIRLVCKVAGFLKRHIDSQKPTSITNTCLAKNIENAWRTQSSHKVFEETDELTDEQANLIKGWLARNVK